MLERGGIIIDNPDMRELQLWDAGDGLQNTFQDIQELASRCKFTDCRHETEPGCMVKKAILERSLSQARFDSYVKLQRELQAVERKKSPELRAAEKKKWKKLGHMGKEIRSMKERGI